jgi:uncharacterized membrane protein
MSDLETKIISFLRTVTGATAWSMRSYVGEMDRPTISKALQRLKRKGLVRTDVLQRSYWKATAIQESR